MNIFLWTQEEYNGLIHRLNVMTAKLNTIIAKDTQMAIDVSALTAEVTRNSDVTASVVQLVNNLAAQIAAIPASTDPVTQAALDALKATLTANDDAIADAVTANTKAG
jgi:small-conductance mechanosensitive channel